MRGYGKYLTLASSAALAQGFLLLISPLVTRLYIPEDVGAFGIVLGMGALIGSMATGRLEHAVPVAKSYVAAVQVVMLGGVMVATVTVWALFGVIVAKLIDFPAIQGLPLFAIPLIALSLATYQLVTALLLRRRSYRIVGVTKLYQGGWTGGAQLALGVASFGATGLIWAQAMGYLAAGWHGLHKVLPRVRSVILTHGLGLRETFVRFRRFPLLLAPAAMFNQAAQHLPVLAIGYVYGLYSAGLYALVMRVCGAPLGLLGQSVAQVYASEFRIHIRDRREGIAREYIKMFLLLLALGCFAVSMIVLLMILWGPQLFGANWTNIGTVSLLVSPMLLMDFATTPVSMTLAYLGRERVQLVWDIVRLMAVVGVFVASDYFMLRHGQALVLLATVWALSLLLHTTLTYFACRTFSAGEPKQAVSV